MEQVLEHLQPRAAAPSPQLQPLPAAPVEPPLKAGDRVVVVFHDRYERPGVVNYVYDAKGELGACVDTPLGAVSALARNCRRRS